MNDDNTESESLKLLSDLQVELCDALNSLQGQEIDGLIENYPLYTAALINRVVEGYIYLRQSGRIEASKFLIRTAIEAAFRVEAVRKKPYLLFRILFTEFEEDKKWVRRLKSPDAEGSLQEQWDEHSQAYRAKYPDHECVEKCCSAWDAAECAGINRYYESHYRLYGHFTHAHFRAAIGDMDNFEREDNRVMTLCAILAIDALVSIGATAANLQVLKERLGNVASTGAEESANIDTLAQASDLEPDENERL